MAFADIFKCQDGSGVTSFQNSPCKEGDTQDITRAKRGYLSAQTIEDLSPEKHDLLWDDVLTGDIDATEVYLRIMKNTPIDYFSPNYKSPKELRRIERERYRNSDVGKLQRTIDEQNTHLRDQADMFREQKLENKRLMGEQTRSLKKQESQLEELNRQNRMAERKSQQLKFEENIRRSQEDFERNERDARLQYRLDEIENEIRNPF